MTALVFDLGVMVSDKQQGDVVILWEDYGVLLSSAQVSVL